MVRPSPHGSVRRRFDRSQEHRATMLQPGTPIGRYEIQRKLARGGMGTVYVAQDPVLGRMVALKVFVGDLDVPDAAERFAREARAAASLNHTNIVTIYDFGEVASQPYIVMEYIQGETMAEIIRRRTPVAVAEKVRWLEELCAGVASAHKMDVVHRDIKPSNLMLDRTGRLKILDFGIAKIINSLGASKTAVLGTPGYMAPEQLLGQPVDARTDIFAVGVVAYELLTYEEAFQGDSFTAVTHRIINEDVRRLSDMVPDLPPDLCAIVERSLQKDPSKRYPDAEAMRVALHRIRRRMERAADFDPSAAPTVISPLGAPVRRIGTGTSGKAVSSGVRTAELTPPPPDPTTEREAVARARATKIDASLQRGEACLQRGEFDNATAACREVLALEPTHLGALALDQRIMAAAARHRAAALLADARAELGRGALTRCKTLLDEARQLDPQARDAALERDLRLARVELERQRQRTETADRTIATARAALDRGDAETALACAREALTLDPNSQAARDIELATLRALEITEESRPTMLVPGGEALEDGFTVIATPPALPGPPTTSATSDELPPTLVPPPVPIDVPPARTSPPRVATAAPASVAAPTPDVVPVTVATGATPVLPATPAAAPGALRAVPRKHSLALVGVAAAVLLGIMGIAYLSWRSPAVPPTGMVVIEALPWANVTAITDENGTSHLTAPAATPVPVALPAGSYQVELTGPPPGNEKRTLTIEVTPEGTTVPPPTRFRVPTSEEYFSRYFGGAPSAPDAAGATP